MPERIIRLVTPIKLKWDGLTRRQRIQLVSACAALVLALILFLFFTFRTRWVAMYDGENYHRLSQVAAELDRAGIRNRISADGRSLYVPHRSTRDAQSTVWSSDLQVAAQMPLADALNLTGLGTTEAERAATLLANHASEVRELLLTQNDILDAQVWITPADRNLMLRPNQPPAAMGVTIHTTRLFSASEGRRLAELLRTTVRGLEMDSITILDQHGNAVFTRDMVGDDGGANDVWQQRNREEVQMLANIAEAWLPMFNDVSLAHNFAYEDRIDENVRIVTFSAPDGSDMGLPSFHHMNRQEAEGMPGWNWGPGLGANMQATPAYMMGDQVLSSASAQELIQSLVHDVHEVEINIGPGGMIRELSNIAFMAVVETDVCETTFFERNPEATVEDWWAEMDATPRAHIANAGEEVEAIRTWIAQATGIPLANIGVTIQEVFNIVHAEEDTLPIATIIMLIVLGLLILLLLIAILARRREEDEEIEPELSVEDLLATTQLEEAKDEAERLKEIEYDTDNEIKKQIDKFVTEKPEAVAALLRNWLNAEEW